MKVVIFVSLFFAFLLISCTGNKDSSVITYQLSKSDYVEKITVPGTVQAVVNTPVMPPRIWSDDSRTIAQDGAYVKKGDTICVLSAPEIASNYRANADIH